jgi:hypothetical protein
LSATDQSTDLGAFLHEFWIDSIKLADTAKEVAELYASGDAQGACDVVAFALHLLGDLPELYDGLLRDFEKRGIRPAQARPHALQTLSENGKQSGVTGLEPDRPTYWVLNETEFPGVGTMTLRIARRTMPDVDWQLVRWRQDVPLDALCVLSTQMFTDGFGSEATEIRLYRRREDGELEFRPTKRQLDKFGDACQRLLDEISQLLADTEQLDPSKPADRHLGMGYTKMVDIELARLRLVEARFKAGNLDYAEEADKGLAAVHEYRAKLQTRRQGVPALNGSH